MYITEYLLEDTNSPPSTALSLVNDAPGIASFLRLALTQIAGAVFTVISTTQY